MKKKILGASLGIVAMAIFTFTSTVGTVEAQNGIIKEDPSGTYDFTICYVQGGPHQTGCTQPAIAGPCWTYRACH